MSKKTINAIFPWTQNIKSLLKELGSSEKGISQEEVEKRLKKYGFNELPEEKEAGIFSALKDAFMDPLALVLSGAAILSAVIGFLNGEMQNISQAILIEGIVVFMALVGFFTDRQANNSLEKLKELQKTFARVKRNGSVVEIESKNLVVGDIILLKEGDKVPADARIISAVRAEANEALLTGESSPAIKNAHELKKETILAQRSNMLFSGTYIESGNVVAVVTEVGTKTELGKIWEELKSADETQTPLQKQLDVLGKFLLWGTLSVCVAVVSIFIWRGQNILDALIVAVSLAIAFIPEALGAVITIALALGVQEMVKKKAIIRKLRAAEGLGSVSVVCTDKTGTITVGKMNPVRLWTSIDGEKEINQNVTTSGTETFLKKTSSQERRLMDIARLCNNRSDASEKALSYFSIGIAGFDPKRSYEIPFTSERKMMSVVVENKIYTKGATEKVLQKCFFSRLVSKAAQKRILKQKELWEDQGYRVMAFADKEISKNTKINDSIEKDLNFVGLVALSDPARSEVKETVSLLKQAGIAPIMITGDSARTALAIAKEVGILPETATVNDVLTGDDLDVMPKIFAASIFPETREKIIRTRVFARTTPAHKIAIVRAFQQSGKLVAMSGDGVNDAPSIKQADVGIAMVSGTEITKETADVILTGSYEAIASAVEIGRVILQRTRLYTHALLSTNGAEVLVFLVAAIAGWPAPLTAVQLLVINLLGDSWLSIALATEKPEKNTMKKLPRSIHDSIITKYMYTSIGIQSIVTTIVLSLGFLVAIDFSIDKNLPHAQMIVLQQTVIFSIFMIQKVLRSAFTARSLDFSLWKIGFFSNKWSLAAAGFTILLTMAALYIPFFGMMPVPKELWTIVLFLGAVPAAIEEIVKSIKYFFFSPITNVSVVEEYGSNYN